MKITYALMLLALPASLAASPILYAMDDDTNTLVTIDRTTFAINAVGPTGVATGDFGDLTYDSNHNVLYWSAGRSNNNLYTLDQATGTATLVGNTGLGDLFALAYDTANNTLYGVAGNFNLYSINTATGTPSLIGATGTAITPGGLAYRADNDTLYLNTAGASSMYTLNVATGAATLFSAGPGFVDDGGITWDPLLGLFWGGDWGTSVHQYNSGYTTSTTVANYSAPLDGIAYADASGAAATPEPATFMLTFGAGAALCLIRRRSQRRGTC